MLPIEEILDATPGGLLLVGDDRKGFAEAVLVRHGRLRALWKVAVFLWRQPRNVATRGVGTQERE